MNHLLNYQVFVMRNYQIKLMQKRQQLQNLNSLILFGLTSPIGRVPEIMEEKKRYLRKVEMEIPTEENLLMYI